MASSVFSLNAQNGYVDLFYPTTRILFSALALKKHLITIHNVKEATKCVQKRSLVTFEIVLALEVF